MQQGTVTVKSSTEGAAPEGPDNAMVKRFEDGQKAAEAGLSTIPTTPPVAPTDGHSGVDSGNPGGVRDPDHNPAEPVKGVPTTPTAPVESFVDSVLKNAGVSREGLTKELAEGGLSEATYAALAKAGVDRETVDQYTSGQVAVTKAQQDAFAESVISGTVKTEAEYAKLVTSSGSRRRR